MKLHVCLDGKLTGTLEMTGGRYIFAYTEEWLGTSGAYPPVSPISIFALTSYSTHGQISRQLSLGAPSRQRTDAGELGTSFPGICA
jgi:hypothetical protein